MLAGVIVHGHGCQIFIDFLQWAHDPNLTLNILLNALCSHFQKLKDENSTYPKKLYLQLDNTARENKNQNVLAFLAFLIQQQVFIEVTVFYAYTEVAMTQYTFINVLNY